MPSRVSVSQAIIRTRMATAYESLATAMPITRARTTLLAVNTSATQAIALNPATETATTTPTDHGIEWVRSTVA